MGITTFKAYLRLVGLCVCIIFATTSTYSQSPDELRAKAIYDSLQRADELSQTSINQKFSSTRTTIQENLNLQELVSSNNRYEKLLHFLRWGGAFMLVVLIASIAMLIIHIKKRRKLLKEHQQLYDIAIKKQKKILLSPTIKNLPSLPKEEKSTPNYTHEQNLAHIAERVQYYLIEKEHFLNPNLLREKLALEVGTNITYLDEAIKKHFGMTYSLLISELKLNYALKILHENPNFSLTELSEKLAITHATFIRLFRKRYEMTPSEFRAIALQAKKKDEKK